jgi:hypothetical protein
MKALRPNINIDNYTQLYDLFLEKTFNIYIYIIIKIKNNNNKKYEK